ncbi:XP_036369325.1uncharacterized protein LOC118767948 [Octopus vulgaris]|uniref:XP_036369325.1uncharacterized protein LOC118767948 n=1 Tax=Octopus vulgaris TaxID=6645 RepID=A0AA36BWD0_OCTVU|nr:XP_036369325.1uncharacterized protein LOC118767948 [Octopus vulgaris]
MLKLFSIILLQWALTSQGFYFRTELDWEAEQKPQKAITKECLQYSKDLDCRFHYCLHERFPCNDDLRKGEAHAHCVKARELTKKLTDVGKIWINSITKCFAMKLTELYKRPSIDCSKVDAMILKIQKECYTANDFCNVGWKHRKELWYLFNEPIKTSKSRHYKMLWNNIAKISSECNTPSAEKLIPWVKAHFDASDDLATMWKKLH